MLMEEIMIVSQFTLYASTKRVTRPSFIKSASGNFAEKSYLNFVDMVNRIYKFKVKTGKFGTSMNIVLNNDGPVTIVIDSKAKNSMDLKNLQIIVDNWIKEHGVRYFDELTNMAQLTEEVGEVARIISLNMVNNHLKKMKNYQIWVKSLQMFYLF